MEKKLVAQEKGLKSYNKPVKAKRIRGRPLQRIRKEHFSKNPLCVNCFKKGIFRQATQLDHIVALDNGGLDVEENRQGLCVDCHVEKTAIDIGYKKKVKIGLDGFPIES